MSRAAIHLPDSTPTVTPETPQASAMLAACGEVDGERVLIVGRESLDAMCALIRRGAREVTVLRPCERPEAASADLILAPHIDTEADADRLLAGCRRTLTPFGRVVLRVTAAEGDRLARRIARMLPTYTLSLVRARRVEACVVIAAERPFSPGDTWA